MRLKTKRQTYTMHRKAIGPYLDKQFGEGSLFVIKEWKQRTRSSTASNESRAQEKALQDTEAMIHGHSCESTMLWQPYALLWMSIELAAQVLFDSS